MSSRYGIWSRLDSTASLHTSNILQLNNTVMHFPLFFTETSPESSIGKPVCSPSIGSPPSAKVTKRTHFTPQQIYKLEQFFLKSQFPTAKDRGKLATELRLSAKHIQVDSSMNHCMYAYTCLRKAMQASSSSHLVSANIYFSY